MILRGLAEASSGGTGYTGVSYWPKRSFGKRKRMLASLVEDLS